MPSGRMMRQPLEEGKLTISRAAASLTYPARCTLVAATSLSRSYGYDAAAYKRWFDSSRPSARRYHDAIVDGRGLTEIKNVADARPGDILAIKYLIEKNNTGHVMLVVQCISV